MVDNLLNAVMVWFHDNLMKTQISWNLHEHFLNSEY
jgi:hypothetical protein